MLVSASTPRGWFLLHPKGVVVRREGAGVSILGEADARSLGVDAALAQLIGDETWAAALPEGASIAEPFSVLSLRDVFAELGDEHFVAAGRATQVLEWAATSRYCGRCGTPTERVPTERSMRCPSCGLLAYPRIAPAIIVLVRKGPLALLARGARMPSGYFSTLAGFAEPGETLEQALAREVFEEVGVRVKNATYFGSQPWPFPHSLMVGFLAEWEGGEIRVDGEEILEAGWYASDALPKIPPRISISRHLIDAWLAELGAAPKG